MNLKKLNTYVGWMVFAIATVVYLMTLEETTSLWDCGEYITTAYKLEVGHPPGAPLFMMLGRLFSMFTSPENAAYMINAMSGLSSSFTILFLFWTITLLGKKIALKDGGELTDGRTLAIIGSALVGSLAYTFTDSFWFSAVEGEVYAMASLFTAIVFWAILKWDDELRYKQKMLQETGRSSLRWIILIMFILGLAIGVHLLGLLAIPAIAYVIYFNHYKKITVGGFIITGVIGVFTLGFIQEGIIPGTVRIASAFERSFVNSFGLPFNSGTIVFFILLIAVVLIGLHFSRKAKSAVWNTAVLSFAVLMIGYSCFAMIVIRSNANTPLDENDPENLVTLHSYLKREQYGQFPLVYGQYFNSKRNQSKEWKDGTPTYLRRFVIKRAGKDVKGFKHIKEAEAFKAKNGGEIVEKYYLSNDAKQKFPTYEQNTFFPRMYANQAPDHKKDGYRNWSGYDENLLAEKKSRKRSRKKNNIGSDGKRVPTFNENMTYFMNYQVNFMYWRYFLWNFSGRQNDIQSHGGIFNGNWQTGFNFIDSQRIGDQSNAPNYTKNNPSNNKFYLLPLILGIIGMIFHFMRAKKDAFVVMLLFFFTGLAIVVYLNQKPMEPRERDYAYAGSFYAFAIWIGLSVFALYEATKQMTVKKWLVGAGGFGALALIFLISGLVQNDYSILLSWMMIGLITGLMLLIMTVLKKSPGKMRAIVAIALTIGTPILMGVQGWDDHDRSGRTTARDLAYNYLVGCGPNGILFANGDNDTFPLWYMQEVEGYKKDVRVSNLSLLGTDWYTEQMTFKTYDSDPLPISFTEEQYRMSEGYLDQVMFQDLGFFLSRGWTGKRFDAIFEYVRKGNEKEFDQAHKNNITQVQRTLLNKELQPVDRAWVQSMDSVYANKSYAVFYSDVVNKALRAGLVVEKEAESLLKTISLDGLPSVSVKSVSDFMRNEDNLTYIEEYKQKMMIVPFTKLHIPVNKDTVKAYGYVDERNYDKVVEKIEFNLTGSLLKDDIMMLETIAHNDWKRIIQFTSPGGSSVTDALRKVGHVAMQGMVYKLTPVKFHGIEGYGYIDLPELTNNLMRNYKFGGIKNGVLVDYYTRRHTNTHRMQFYVAAKAYLDLEDRFTGQIAQLSQRISSIEASADSDPRLSLQLATGKRQLVEIKADLAALGNAKDSAAALINKSIEELPIGHVIEFGDKYQRNYLPGYIEILYRANADNKDDVAIQILDLMNGQFEYFTNLDVDQINEAQQFISVCLRDYKELYDQIEKIAPESIAAKEMELSFNNFKTSFTQKMSEFQKAMKKDKKNKKANRAKMQFLGMLVSELSLDQEPMPAQ